MPHLLNITDGTTTLPLSTTSALLKYFVPRTPELDQAGQYGPVGESIDLLLYAATTTAVQTAHNNLERMLLAARRRRQNGAGARVFLQYQPMNDPVLWRSEILGGEMRLGKGAMTTYGQAKLPVQLLVERVPFWEGTRAAIPLTNGNGSNNTSGLTVYAHDDSTAGHDNWTDIAGSAVGGVLPSPLEIHMRNISGAGRGYAHFHVANNIFGTSLAHILEAENRTGGYGSVSADAESSNSQKLVLSGASSLVCTWDLPAALLQTTAGRYMRLLARFPFYAETPRIYVKAAIRDYYGLVTLAEQPTETLLATNDSLLADLGLLPFPPGGYSSSWAKNVLHLSFRASSAMTVHLDFLQLTPADEYCYRHIEQRGMTVAANDWIVDDGIEGLQYLIEGGANHPIYTEHTPPLHVFPGVAQRLYFLHDGVSPSANWTLSIKAFYRPRRLTI